MIPHAPISLAGAIGALVVAVVGAALVAGPVALAGLPGSLGTALLAARLATVRVAVIAPAVYPELVAALLALSKSDIQLSSTRSKNWTPTLLGRILAPTYVDRSGVRRTRAAPRRLGALTPGLLPFTTYVARQRLPRTRSTPFSCLRGTRAPVIPLKRGPRHAGGDKRRNQRRDSRLREALRF
jgi:hypothetical protein